MEWQGWNEMSRLTGVEGSAVAFEKAVLRSNPRRAPDDPRNGKAAPFGVEKFKI